MNSKDDFLVTADAQLFLLQSKVNLLKARAKGTDLETKPEYNKFLNELMQKQDVAKEKVRQLESAENDVWKDLKKGANKALNDLDHAITEAASVFGK
jgi:hypothetical protein